MTDSDLFFGNTRSPNGTIIWYQVREYAAATASKALEVIGKRDMFREAASVIDSDLLNVYFLNKIFDEVFPISAKICILNEKGIDQAKDDYNDLKFNINRTSNLFWCEFIRQVGDGDIFSETDCNMTVDKNAVSGYQHMYSYIRNIYKRFSKHTIGGLCQLLDAGEHWNRDSPIVGVRFLEGIDREKRSDIYWFKESGIDPSQLLVYFHSKYNMYRYGDPTKLLAEMGCRWVVHSSNYRIPIGKIWWEHGRIFHDGVKTIERSAEAHRPIDKYDDWIKKSLGTLLKNVSYWYEFFVDQNIKIHYETEEGGQPQIEKVIAIDLAGGLSFRHERGNIMAGESFLGCYPQHLFFTWGERSAKHLIESTNTKKNIILSGYPYNNASRGRREKLKEEINRISDNRSNFTLLFLDTNHSENNNLVYQLISTFTMTKIYTDLLIWVINNDRISLVIKPKKYQSISGLPGVKSLISDAIKTGRILLVDEPYGVKSKDYGSYVDMVVSVGSTMSSALLECILTGRRGIFYDYANLFEYERDIYEWGKDRVIFSDPEKMFSKLKTFFNEGMGDLTFGNWSNHCDEFDPFRDDDGNKRIGSYIRSIYDGYCLGRDRATVVTDANAEYSKRWGQDKIFHPVSDMSKNVLSPY